MSPSSTLILSRLILNPLRRDVQRDLADCHNMHRRLLLAFPDLPDITHAREHYGLLYRVEQTRESVIVLAQSTHIPDWSRLPQGYLADTATTKSLTSLYDRLRPGMDLLFRLHANPTRRISNRNTEQDAKWRGKRVNITHEADQIEWLRRKSTDAGFTLLAIRPRPAGLPIEPPSPVAGATTTSPTPIPDTRARPGGAIAGRRASTGSLTFGSVTLEGRLRITDPAAFLTTLQQGIGSGKAYGFGLLSIAPAPAQ